MTYVEKLKTTLNEVLLSHFDMTQQRGVLDRDLLVLERDIFALRLAIGAAERDASNTDVPRQ